MSVASSGSVPPDIPLSESSTGSSPNGPSAPTATQQPDANSTVRMIAMIGVIACGAIQGLTLGNGDEFIMVAIAGLLAWFILGKHIAPIYLLFMGNLIARLALLSNRYSFAFRDSNPADFVGHLFDSVTFVGLIAFAFIYYELTPKRLREDWSTPTDKKNWHMLEPFSGLLVRIPIAVTVALIIYFLSQQIWSPIDPRILRIQFAQAYMLCCILFVVFILARTFFDIWSWKKLTASQAQFYIHAQTGLEVRDELDAIQKPGWSRIDHPSAVGGMFFIQWIISGVMAAILVFNARASGSEFMWPAVAAIFVFLTALYNSIRASRNNITSENHVIAVVSFIVLCVVGMQSLHIPRWPWKMIYFSWWSFNATIIIRMSYLWLLDESFARKNNWETARPFSVVRLLVVMAEGLFALFVLYLISLEMLDMVFYP